MPPTVTAPPQSHQTALTLKQVIESVYTDGISAILKTHLGSDGTIAGKFVDGAQVYDFSISANGKLEYNEAEASGGRSDAYLMGYTIDSGMALRQGRIDAPATIGRTPKCEKGKRCGGGCIKKGLKCSQMLSPAAKQALAQVKSSMAKVTVQPPTEPSASKAPKKEPQDDQASTPFYQNKLAIAQLAAVGLNPAGAIVILGGAGLLVHRDLDASQVKDSTIRIPPNGIPDEETFKTYDTFQPGDMIRRTFSAPGWGTRQHYGVYAGKDPETGEHMMIGCSMGAKDGEPNPMVYKHSLSKDSKPGASQYEQVPASDMKLGTKVSKEDALRRAESMLGTTFVYKGFESNCESLARSIAQGEAYSTQKEKVSPFTNAIANFVTDNASKVSVTKTKPGEKPKPGIRFGSVVIRRSVYAKDKERMTAQQIAESFKKEKARQDSSESAGLLDEFFAATGLPSPQEYEKAVAVMVKQSPGMANPIRVEMYKNYIMMLLKQGSKPDPKNPESKSDGISGRGKPCGNGYIAAGLECRVGMGKPQKGNVSPSALNRGSSRLLPNRVASNQKVLPDREANNKPSQVPFDQDPHFAGKLQPVGLTPKAVQSVLGGVLVGVAVAATASVATSAGVVANDLKKAGEAVPFEAIRQPPDGKPDAETIKVYDTFQPGDVIRKNFKVPGGAWQHYSVYTGKDPETGEHMMIDVSHAQNDGATEMKVRKRSLISDASPDSTQFERVPEADLYPDGNKPYGRDEILDRVHKMTGKTFTYQGFTSNCESFARGIVSGKAESTQRDRITRFGSAVSTAVTEAALRIKKTEKGFGLSQYNSDKTRMTAAQMMDWLDADAKRRTDSDDDLAPLPMPVIYASGVEVLAEKFPAIADLIRIEMYKRYFLAMFAMSSQPQKKADSQTRQDKGKPCGKGYIAANLECQAGEQPSLPLPKGEASSRGNAGARIAGIGAIAGAALIGTPIAGYLAMRERYRSGFTESANMAKAEGEKMTGQPRPVSDYERNLASTVGIVMPTTEKMIPDQLYGSTPIMREVSKQALGTKPSEMTVAKQITLVANGFDGRGDANGGASVASDLSGAEFDDHHIVPISNQGFAAEPGKTGIVKPEDALKAQLSTVLREGRNPVAVRMAATAYAFHRKHPALPINLVGYSGAGMATHEAAEILKKLNIPVKVANFGSPYFGLTEKVGDSITFNSQRDYVTEKTPVRDEINVSSVKDHSAYLKNDIVRAKLKDFFDDKTIVGEEKKALTKEEKAKMQKRRKAMERAVKMEESRTARQAQEKKDTDISKPNLDRYVAALIKPVLREGHSDVHQIIKVAPKDSGLTGYFADSKNRPFSFDISASGKLSYKSAVRRDFLGKDQCQKGMPCGSACVPQGDKCELTLSAGSQAMVKLALRTYATEEVPTREEVTHAMGLATREFLQNPVKAVKEGFQREKIVRQAVELQTGKPMPTKQAIAHTAMKKAGEKMTSFVKDLVKQNAEEGAVNTVGLTGSIVGGAIAGPLGALAGDVGGALATRKAITDYKALQRARASLKDDEAFQSAGKLSQLKKLGAATLSELKSAEMQKEIEDNLTGDVAGWAIGNGAAVALTAAGVGIPLKGAAVAIASTPTVVKAHRRIREGENAGKVIRETAQEVATAPVRALKSGNDREQQARVAASKAIRKFKSGVK